MNPFIKKILCLALGLLNLITTTSIANVNFADADGSITIDTTTSKLAVANPAKVIGWGLRSVVKSFGDNASSAWIEGYTSNSVVGQLGLTGITNVTRTNLIDANSNAINASGGGLLRATSNLLLYTARTYSSSILVLRSRADSTSLSMRGTSNAVNSLYRSIAVPTADSIDGTVFAKYVTNHYVFHNNGNAWTARGWVRFNNGFTIMPLGSVLMDTLTTVSGGFDLRDTGTLILNNDLYLAHNVTLTNGGNIKGQASSTGQANTIFMGGDLTLASTTYARTLHITGDWSNSGTSGNLIIDGCGHTLNIGDRAQIFVDQNITLTLRNMTIKTGPKSLNNPAIQLASHGSKLALDNVMFDLGADFHFMQGQIFVHDEVAVTGTSAFVYQSPKPSYITSGATWSFEQATTFSVAPSTFTDCPFTVNNTYTNNAFLVLADASSALSLNGCSFQTTFTGLRLRSGMVLFDNKVAIDTTAGVDLATTGTTPVGYVGGAVTGGGPRCLAWSPDGRFLAVANNNFVSGNTFQIFQFNSINPPLLLSTISTGPSSQPQSVAWSPDGRFLAEVNPGLTTRGLQVFRFNGSSTPTLLGSVSVASNPPSVAWSPDGRFLAQLNQSAASFQVYRFNGSNAPTPVGGTVGTGSTPNFIVWSPDGRFLAIVNVTSPTTGLQIYRFNGKSTPTSLGTASTGTNPWAVAWSPDGRFLTVINQNVSGTLQVYRFNGSNAPISLGTVGTGSQPAGVTWSPDGRFLAVGNYASPATGLQIYRFDGSSAPTSLGAVGTGNSPYSVAWSPDGRFIAIVNYTVPGTLQIFRCNYVYSGQPAQGFSNGLLFGDKLKGSSFDANVNVLSGAVVKVRGMIKDDSA